MGAGLKSCRVTDEGIYARSDWSHFNQAEILKDRNFWRQFSMLFLSSTFFYFMKLHFTIYGSQLYENTYFLVKTSYHNFYFGAISRLVAPYIM